MICPAGKVHCLHYDEDSIGCKADERTTRNVLGYEQCPWESKIQAPKKYPMEECVGEIVEIVARIYGGVRIGFLGDIKVIVKKHWPKDKPNQDKRGI